jgi:hypothetical protein
MNRANNLIFANHLKPCRFQVDRRIQQMVRNAN